MSKKELAIFNLCNALVDLLGEKEAIADLKKLYKNHPEMFKDMKEVSHIINEVVNEPEIIIKNPKPKSEKDFIAVKHLSDKEDKIGDIGIRNDKGTNVIFHANVSPKRNFQRLAKREQVVAGEAVLSLHTSRPAELGGDNQKLSGANAHSATTEETIPQENKEVKPKSLFSKIKQNLARINQDLEHNLNEIQNDNFSKKDLENFIQNNENQQENTKEFENIESNDSKKDKKSNKRR